MRLLLTLRIDRDGRAEFLSYRKLLAFCVRFVMCEVEFYVFRTVHCSIIIQYKTKKARFLN